MIEKAKRNAVIGLCFILGPLLGAAPFAIREHFDGHPDTRTVELQDAHDR